MDSENEAGRIREREADILGSPPRIIPMSDDEITDAHRAILPTPAANAPVGVIVDYTRILLRNPELMQANRLAGYFLRQGKWTPRDRELAILRVAWLNRAPFVWGEHVKLGKQVGVTSEEIERVTQGPDAPGWSEHDGALIRAVDELRTDAMVSDATWAVLARTFDEAQLIELPALVGAYMVTTFTQNALRIPLVPGNPGLAAR